MMLQFLVRRLAALSLLLLVAVAPAAGTVNSSVNKTIVLGNGVTTQFQFSFIGVAATYVSVILTDSSGNETVLTRGAGATQYQITLNAPVAGAIWGIGGTVTYNPSGTPIPSGSTLTIFRTLPLTQAINLQNQNSLATLGKGAETGLDTGTMQLQQASENIARAIVAPIVDATPPAPLPPIAQRANKGAAFDASGNLVAGSTPASGFISSAMQPVVGAATLSLGRTAFGLGSVATESIGSGLEDDGAGNLRVNSALVAVATNQAVNNTFAQKSYIATGPITFTLNRANTLWNGFAFTVYAFTGPVTVTPNANDNFPGLAGGASTTVPAGNVARFTTDAANTGAWYMQLVPQGLSAPQGYLTPCSASVSVSGCVTGDLMPTGDVTGVSTLYYQTGPSGNQIPLYNGAIMMMLPFPELALTLNSNHVANTIYDVCVFNSGGVPTIVTAPAWQTSTAGSGARGTAAAITRTSGYWTNNLAITGRNGASTYSIPARGCTMVGTILIDASNGQVTFHRTWGTSRKWSAWNFYNRQQLYLKAGVGSSWSYTTNVWRPANNTNGASLTVLAGLEEEPYDFGNTGYVGGSLNTNQKANGAVGIGYNSVSSPSGNLGQTNFTNSTASNIVFLNSIRARYLAPPALGAQVITALENGLAADVASWAGTESYCVLSANWRG